MDISNELLIIGTTTVLLISALWLGYDWGFKSGKNFAKSQYEHEIELLQDMVIELEKRLSRSREQDNSILRYYEYMQRECLELSSAYNKHIDKIKKLEDKLLNVKVENRRLKMELIGEKEGLEAQALKEEQKFEDANREKIESLRKIIEPIEEWINENACPHDKLIITQGNVEFTSGEFGIPLKIRD